MIRRPFPFPAMKTAALLLSGLLAFAGLARAAEPTDAEVDARTNAMDMAGAFTNDGYKIRDGHWLGKLKPKDKPQVAVVNLYAGNQYYVSLGTAKDANVVLSVHDETGARVSSELFTNGPTAAVGVAPTISGPYYVSVRQLDGEPATFCLMYSYK